jgi:hypothetical protein
MEVDGTQSPRPPLDVTRARQRKVAILDPVMPAMRGEPSRRPEQRLKERLVRTIDTAIDEVFRQETVLAQSPRPPLDVTRARQHKVAILDPVMPAMRGEPSRRPEQRLKERLVRTIDTAIDEVFRQETVLAEVRGRVIEERLPGDRTIDDPSRREAQRPGDAKPPVPFSLGLVAYLLDTNSVVARLNDRLFNLRPVGRPAGRS